MQTKGPISNVIQTVNVTIHNETLCTDTYPERLTRQMFCAGDYLGRQDACFGDSGGPIVYDPQKILIGIISWGKNCGEKYFPGVYTDIMSIRPWIIKQISNL